MTELTDETVTKLANDCVLAANCMEAEDTFPTGQGILREAARALIDARADAELAVAEAIRRAAQEAHDWFYDPERDRVTDPRLGEAILALTPGDALAEMQRLRDERDSLRQSLDACIPAVEEAAIKRGQAEAERDAALEDLGRVILSLPTGMRLNGAVEGVKGLRAERDAAVALALERAAAMIDETAYTSTGDKRSLEPVGPGLVGMDMHHATIAAAIRALAPADGLAAVEALRKERDAFRRNLRETFEAMCAMRDAINEHIPMPSLESDLLQGPENSVFCAAVAEAVIAERDRLAAANAALEAQVARLVGALEALRHAVCGETGFASCVRAHSGKAYPWPALDEAEALVNAALAPADGLAAVDALRAERDRFEDALARAAQQREARLLAAIEEATDPDFILGAMDNVNDMDVTLDGFAQAASRAIRAALSNNGRGE